MSRGFEQQVFAIDPKIRSLLHLIEKSRDPNDGAEDVLSLQKKIQNGFKSLWTDVNDVANGQSSKGLNVDRENVLKREALASMAEYILLPSSVIMQFQPDINRKEGESSISHLSRRSYWFSTIAEAALMSKLYVELMHNDEYTSLGEIGNERTLISSQVRIRCLIACAMSLHFVVNDQTICHDNDPKIDINTPCAPSESRKSLDFELDRGSFCAQVLLECIDSLCTKPYWIRSENYDRNKKAVGLELTFVQAVFDSMDGNLLAQISLCSLSCLGDMRADGNSSLFQKLRDDSELKVQALQTLQTLWTMHFLKDFEGDLPPKITHMWRKLFPGIFAKIASLTHANLRFSAALSSSRTAKECLKSLSILFNVVLDIESMSVNGRDGMTSVNHDKKELKDLCLAVRREQSTNSEDAQLSVELKTMMQQVNTHVTPVLLIILKLLSSHKSIDVRKTGVDYLCRTLLVKTEKAWGKDSKEKVGDVKIGALECLLSLQEIGHVDISHSCKVVLTEYRQKVGEHIWKQTISSFLIPRTLELIQRLTSIAQSGRENELESHLHFLNGCLAIIQSHAIDNVFLSNRLMEDTSYRCLVGLFRVDASVTVNATNNSSGIFKCSFVYMQRKSTVEAAKSMIKLIAKIMRQKKTLYFIDTMIGNLSGYLSTLQTAAINDLHSHDQMLDQSGSLIISAELIRYHNQFGSVLVSRKKKHVANLARSIIPTLICDSIWKLSTTQSSIISKPPNSFKNRTSLLINAGFNGGANTAHEHSKSMDTNNVFIACSMDVIAAISGLLRADFGVFLPVVLRKMVQKTSEGINSKYIQNVASESIRNIASHVGYQSSAEVMSTYFLPLINSITMDLRQTWSEELFFEQSISFHSLYKIIELLLQSFLSLQDQMKKNALCDHAHAIILSETLNESFAWFNRCRRHCSQESFDRFMLHLTLIRLFTIGSKYFMAQISEWSTLKDPVRSRNTEEEEPWLDILQLHEISTSHESDENSEADANQQQDKNTAELEVENSKGKTETGLDIVKKIKVSVMQMMSSSCYFLSSPDLTVQRQSCDMIDHGFLLLNRITLRFYDSESPVMEAGRKFWSSIRSQFQNTSLLIVNAEKDFEGIPLRYNGSLYSSLLCPIETLCNVAPGAVQFGTDVWPFMSNIIEYDSLIFGERFAKNNQDRTRKMMDEILNSILSCICVYFSSETDGNEGELVPVIGATLIPLLSRDGDVGESATKSLFALAKVDCDSLWRCLLFTGQENFPPRKINPFQPTKVSNKAEPSPVLTKRIRDLISYINQQPEPILV